MPADKVKETYGGCHVAHKDMSNFYGNSRVSLVDCLTFFFIANIEKKYLMLCCVSVTMPAPQLVCSWYNTAIVVYSLCPL